MHIIKILSFFFMTVGVLQQTDSIKPPTKIALLVGINEYEPSTNWPKIHGENDVALIQEALLKRGFKQENIHLLKGKQATKKNIQQKLIEIEKKLTKQSFFVFHFSGHGQQIPDEWSAHKDEVDNYDEALALYNSPMEISNNYEGNAHLIDDDMEAYFQPIRKKIGPNGQLLLLVDACHSGTITRSEVTSLSNPTRGEHNRIIAPTLKTTPIEGKKEITGFNTTSTNKSLANYLVISATRPGDRNQEFLVNDTLYGPLSYAFSTVLSQLPYKANYRRFFTEIQTQMTNIVANQAPCIEGNQALIVGTNQLLPLDNVYEQFTFENRTTLKIPIGRMAGIHEGSTFAFYPKGVDTTGQLVATGKVTQAGLSTVRIRIQLEPGKNNSNIQKAYLLQQDFGDITIRLGLDIENKHFETLLRKKCAVISAIKIVSQSAGIVIQQKKDQDVKVYVDNSEILSKELLDVEAVVNSLVKRTILPYAQIKFLKKLELKDTSVRLTAKLILDDRNEYTRNYLNQTKQFYNTEGLLYVPDSSYYYFEIKNESDKDVYLSMLEISPDYTYSAPLPYDELYREIEDYLIPAGATVSLKEEIWAMGPPLGIEHFYIIGTDNVLDLKELIDFERTRAVPNFHDFNKLFQFIEPDNLTRSGKILPIVPSKINIEKLLVEIIEKQ